jgi:hypothetical protein
MEAFLGEHGLIAREENRRTVAEVLRTSARSAAGSEDRASRPRQQGL